jgi:hypothetical protein
MPYENHCLVKDQVVADMTSMSKSWVRVQRHKRRRGLTHTFDVDPVMVGGSPRYFIDEVEGFIERLVQANDKGGQVHG